jgi:hypothetical protein
MASDLIDLEIKASLLAKGEAGVITLSCAGSTGFFKDSAFAVSTAGKAAGAG